jgi:hypothetical protein
MLLGALWAETAGEADRQEITQAAGCRLNGRSEGFFVAEVTHDGMTVENLTPRESVTAPPPW